MIVATSRDAQRQLACPSRRRHWKHNFAATHVQCRTIRASAPSSEQTGPSALRGPLGGRDAGTGRPAPQGAAGMGEMTAPIRSFVLREAIGTGDHPSQLLQRVVDQAVAAFPLAHGALVGLLDGPVIHYAAGAGTLAGFVGARHRLQGSLAGQAVERRRSAVCADTQADGRVNGVAHHWTGVGSSVVMPLVRGETCFGVLSVVSTQRGAFGEPDLPVVDHLQEFVSVVVGTAVDLQRALDNLVASPLAAGVEVAGGPQPASFVSQVLSPSTSAYGDARRRIEAVIAEGRIDVVFQPIVELRSRAVFGFEALARFRHELDRPPDVWFAEAHQVGLGVELELVAARCALAHVAAVGTRGVLAINAGPALLTDPRLITLLEGVDAGRVFVELTEHATVEDYPRLQDALDRLRRSGVRVAVDDTGAGISSLAHILTLGPEVIKLDRALTTGIDRDPARRALAASLVTFAGETGAHIVAEGIEKEGELDVLLELGVRFGQGFHLARPGPLPGPDEEPPLDASSLGLGDGRGSVDGHARLGAQRSGDRSAAATAAATKATAPAGSSGQRAAGRAGSTGGRSTADGSGTPPGASPPRRAPTRSRSAAQRVSSPPAAGSPGEPPAP